MSTATTAVAATVPAVTLPRPPGGRSLAYTPGGNSGPWPGLGMDQAAAPAVDVGHAAERGARPARDRDRHCYVYARRWDIMTPAARAGFDPTMHSVSGVATLVGETPEPGRTSVLGHSRGGRSPSALNGVILRSAAMASVSWGYSPTAPTGSRRAWTLSPDMMALEAWPSLSELAPAPMASFLLTHLRRSGR